MKSLTFMILGWVLSLSTAWAQEELSPSQKWVEQVDGSFAVPSFMATVEPNPGLGGDINIGYRFDKTLSLLIGSGYYQYNLTTGPPATGAQLSYIPLVGILRLNLGSGPFHPYAFWGTGIAINTFTRINPQGSPISKISAAETDFYLAPGLGIIYAISGYMAVFLQSRIDLDFTSRNGLGIPLSNPSIFIPLQAGISFFVL